MNEDGQDRSGQEQVQPVEVYHLHGSGWIDSGLVGSLGGVPREQKMLKGHLPTVIYNQVY